MNNDDLDYPNLTNCQLRLVGSAATTRPPVRLPRAIRDEAMGPPYSISSAAKSKLDNFSLERAVLKRFEERNRDRSLKGATSRLELEQATIAKMRNVTGAEEDVCIAILEQHGYDVTQSVEAYLEGSLPH